MVQFLVKPAAALWIIGLLNNMPYVIMIAGAKNISEGGTALVFIANILPSLIVKISSPYWFDKVSYRTRMKLGSILMASSFCIVAWFSSSDNVDRNDHNDQGSNVTMQLLGVACGSAQGGLGEATLLALSGKADSIIKNQTISVTNDSDNHCVVNENDDITENSVQTQGKSICIAAFSSGTGFAGVAGFLFVFTCTKIFGITLPWTLICGMIFPILYWYVFIQFLQIYTTTHVTSNDTVNDSDIFPSNELTALSAVNNEDVAAFQIDSEEHFHDDPSLGGDETCEIIAIDEEVVDNSAKNITTMTALERFRLTLTLWPYMLPLFTVYAAEYALQSGVWTAIGFPIDDLKQRDTFYVTSNWVYQIGVFISRSSGAFCTAPMWMLWLMPLLQIVNLIIFYFVASQHFWYNNTLFLGCFYVGLLGGAVYVHGYSRINKDLPVTVREFALSSASVADGLGIVLANISGLFIQSCLYKVNNINGAVVSCPS